MQGNPYWPLKGPRLFSAIEILRNGFFAYSPRYEVVFGPKSGGADGKPTTERSQKNRLSPTRPVVNVSSKSNGVSSEASCCRISRIAEFRSWLASSSKIFFSSLWVTSTALSWSFPLGSR
jgi:hypothetical protein